MVYILEFFLIVKAHGQSVVHQFPVFVRFLFPRNEETFDYVISYAAIYHLEKEDQCCLVCVCFFV